MGAGRLMRSRSPRLYGPDKPPSVRLTRPRTILMVVAGGDYVHFVVEYGGKIEKGRVTETALLNRGGMGRKDAGHAQLIAIFVRHRAEIEQLAFAKLQREGHSDRGVVVTTEDLNP